MTDKGYPLSTKAALFSEDSALQLRKIAFVVDGKRKPEDFEGNIKVSQSHLLLQRGGVMMD